MLRGVVAWRWLLIVPFAFCVAAGLLALTATGDQRVVLIGWAAVAQLLAIGAAIVMTDRFRRRPAPQQRRGRMVGSDLRWTIARTFVVLLGGQLLADMETGDHAPLPLHLSAELSALIALMAMWLAFETWFRRRQAGPAASGGRTAP